MIKGIRIAAVVLGMLTIGLAAEAIPITGSINFSGGVTTGGGNLTTATGLDFSLGSVTGFGPTGSYGAVAPLLTVAFTDFTFSPPIPPTPGIIPLWTFTYLGITYSFDLTSVSSELQILGTQTFLLLSGSGIGHITGLEDTNLTFSLTVSTQTGSPQTTFAFQATNQAIEAVPEPGTMLLLGSALLGLAARRRIAR